MEPRRKHRRWPWVVGGLATFVVVVAVASGSGGSGGSGSTVDTGGDTPQATATHTKAATPAGPKSRITEGVWVVGVDIKAGTYRTVKPVEDGCYWEVDAKPGSDSIVQNDLPTGGRPTVTLKSGRQFTTRDCGDWARS